MSFQLNNVKTAEASTQHGDDEAFLRQRRFEVALQVIASASVPNGERRALRRLALEVFIVGTDASSARAGAQPFISELLVFGIPFQLPPFRTRLPRT